MNVNTSLTTLNDFIFCPYSIYLHKAYMETDEDIFKTIVQLSGTNAHKATNSKKGSSRSCDILSLPVCSNSLGLYGVIDLYRGNTATPIERKLRLNHIFR
ncbi:MAG: type V CRISPR-associated protein Cas4 [Bacteroidales bacterium]|nr:type V CRISPR-associated protein Cas4 [Bacteroidales bacterium]